MTDLLARLVIALLVALASVAAPRGAPESRPTAEVAGDLLPATGGASVEARALLGAPRVEAIPRTRGIEAATTPDPSRQADDGAPPSQPASTTAPGRVTGSTPATPRPSPATTPKPIRTNRASLARRVAGVATWYCSQRSPCTVGYPADGAFAAAGPRLRSVIGPSWRGHNLTVCVPDCLVPRVTARVRLIDECGGTCASLIDLYASVMGPLGGIGPGELDVEVTW